MKYPTYLIHYGISGQKWGNRRWQNDDGSLTPEGYEHYGYGSKKNSVNSKGVEDVKRKKLGFGFSIKRKEKKAEKARQAEEKARQAEEKARINEEISKKGYTIDKYGYANKEIKGVSITFDPNGDKEEYEACKIIENKMPELVKTLDKEANKILKSPEFEDFGISSKHNIKLRSIITFGDGSAEASYWDDGPNDPLYGHELSIEFDPKTGKIRTHSLNG